MASHLGNWTGRPLQSNNTARRLGQLLLVRSLKYRSYSSGTPILCAFPRSAGPHDVPRFKSTEEEGIWKMQHSSLRFVAWRVLGTPPRFSAGRPATLKRWRHGVIGPRWIELEGRLQL